MLLRPVAYASRNNKKGISLGTPRCASACGPTSFCSTRVGVLRPAAYALLRRTQQTKAVASARLSVAGLRIGGMPRLLGFISAPRHASGRCGFASALHLSGAAFGGADDDGGCCGFSAFRGFRYGLWPFGGLDTDYGYGLWPRRRLSPLAAASPWQAGTTGRVKATAGAYATNIGGDSQIESGLHNNQQN